MAMLATQAMLTAGMAVEHPLADSSTASMTKRSQVSFSCRLHRISGSTGRSCSL